MARKYLETTVGFDERLACELNKICTQRGKSRATIIREAVDAYIDPRAAAKANFERMAMTLEFTQVAIDVLIRKLALDRRDDILVTVDERMELYHSGR
jgi:metal-responsive CopG/Arc/MetJ family transcriptional regulator